MNKTSIIEHIVKEQGNSFESCFFGNDTFLDLEPFRHKLKQNWRSSSLLSAVLGDIEPNALHIYPDKRFSWVNLLRVSTEYSVNLLTAEDVYRLFKLSFIWSDIKLLQLTVSAYQRLQLPLPFDSTQIVHDILKNNSLNQHNLLTFQPLTSDMLVDFYWQYACKDLVHHCGLPHFTSNQQWYQWIDELANDMVELDFIKHKDWGVVGGLFLQKVSELGFLRFWIGKDFRNQGMATRAVNQWMTSKREHNAFAVVYSEVMQSNIAGRQTLIATGFERVLIERVPPYDKRLFYRYGPTKSFSNAYSEIQALTHLFSDIKELDKPKSATELLDTLRERLHDSLKEEKK